MRPAGRTSEMTMTIMKLIPAEEMLVGETRREVEAESPHQGIIGQLARMLGGNPGSRTSLVGWEPVSSDEETMI